MNINYNKEKLKKFVTRNMEILNYGNKNYPEKLKNICSSPKTLYLIGNKNLLYMKSIAIIGCRECTKIGAYNAYKFGYELAKKGICIISGLAKGIDAYSHIGAIKAKGRTIAVLGSGLDIIYPKENKEIYFQILKNNGLIVSEYELGSKPEKHHFPARNRIISGLSDGVLVVEAKKRSGTLITVDFALDQGKDIYAIPGSISNENSYGTNNLIKEGAFLVTNVEDIII